MSAYSGILEWHPILRSCGARSPRAWHGMAWLGFSTVFGWAIGLSLANRPIGPSSSIDAYMDNNIAVIF